jgi:DNA polymerase-4
MRDDPRLRDQPLAIGGSKEQRGVIATCNYVARRFGIHSAMATSQAMARCPNLVLLPPNMEKYRIASRRILAIYHDYTDLVEPLSLDEAYLDVSSSPNCKGSATLMAQEIRARIASDVGITASAGVAANKFLAKIASDWHKPDGLFVIHPHEAEEFVAVLPVDKLFGVGKVTASKLKQLGVHTCLDLRQWTLPQLQQRFGKFGSNLYHLCRGIDQRAVEPYQERKSVSVEETYTPDLPDLAACLQHMPELLASLQARIERAGAQKNIQKLYVKLRFADFRRTTVECVAHAANLSDVQHLLATGFARGQALGVRLLGIGVRLGETDNMTQLPLFEAGFDAGFDANCAAAV